jgi:glutathione S-transferase
MITVHHLGISQSERIVWLCEELGIAYELKTYPREPNGAAPAAYKALHPQGTAPVITDGSLVLAETGAIVDYILARHGGGRLVLGPQAPDFPDYLYWLHFGNGFFVPHHHASHRRTQSRCLAPFARLSRAHRRTPRLSERDEKG